MNFKKIISNSVVTALVSVMFLTPILNTVSAMESSQNDEILYSDASGDEDNEVTSSDEEDEVEVFEDLILSDEEIAKINQYLDEQKNNENNTVKSRNKRSLAFAGAAGWAGTFAIPGVGQVLLTATGAIVIGGVVISAGSWVAQKVKNWIYQSKKENAEKAKKAIPSSLKKKNGNVDLDSFTVRVRGKNAYKDPKTGYIKEKDTTGHRGYDGSVKKWKIKNKKGKRIASVNGSGKVVDK